ncbi:MAG: hypothetical protein JSS29_14320 [Proteobacteria bacterium]|nr:hypothetical protein [Pseudomonadota bacterium]
MRTAPTRFDRFLLPGFAFKAFVIGGGYATGRELAEFFLPSGPTGGVLGMLLGMGCWSLICCVTFLFARMTRSFDYGTFFRQLLGPGAVVFDVVYAAMVLIVLSVYGAAAGEIGHAVLGWPTVAGTLLLVCGVAAVAAFGNDSVERLFKVVTYFLYAVYVGFVALALWQTGPQIAAAFAAPQHPTGWVAGGLTYAGYNVIGAVVILPVLRHLTGRRDALIAGLLAGPLGMLPALLFFVCMMAYYPAIGAVALPSDYMLARIGVPAFHFVFQLMIFAALLESGTGAVHAVNQRVAGVLAARGRAFGRGARLACAAALLVVSIFVATRFGLIALIARGYRLLAYLIIAVYVVPVLSYGLWRVLRTGPGRLPTPAAGS